MASYEPLLGRKSFGQKGRMEEFTLSAPLDVVLTNTTAGNKYEDVSWLFGAHKRRIYACEGI